MIHSNFIFDGTSCDEYGLMVVSFHYSSSTGTQEAHHVRNLSTEYSRRSGRFDIISGEYNAPLSFEVQVIRCDGQSITQEQERAVKKWLMKKNGYAWFSICDKHYADIWMEVTFTSAEHIRVQDVVGLSFQGVTSAPYAYSEQKEETYLLIDDSRRISLYVDNDEEDVIYPDIEINMINGGGLEIKNSLEESKNTFRISDTAAGEIIRISGGIPSIESSADSVFSTIYDRFSKHWLSLSDGENILTVSHPCEITIRYRETRKVGV